MKTQDFVIPDISDLYVFKSQDFLQGSHILGEAFREDPIWSQILKKTPEKFAYLFEVPLKYTLKYGKIYSPSPKLEGIAAWLPSTYVDMPIWRLLRSGSLPSAFKLGPKIGLKIDDVFSQLVHDRKKIVQPPYIYLFALGVNPKYQGKGFGTLLVSKMLEALPRGIPVYLETESEKNVQFYENFGFEVKNSFTTKKLGLPMWEMLHPGK